MALTRTFVSFSSADIKYYRTMLMWKAHEHIDFNFADFQLDEAINSNNPYYIRTVCRAKIRRAEPFVLLIPEPLHFLYERDEVCARGIAGEARGDCVGVAGDRFEPVAAEETGAGDAVQEGAQLILDRVPTAAVGKDLEDVFG